MLLASTFFSYVFLLICSLISMSFFTLLERKVLGYIQLRKGPNKVGPFGILQPFADALKLFSKELNIPSLSNYIPFMITPSLALLLALILWYMYPSSSPTEVINFSVLLFLCISSLSVYTTLSAGWTSNSKYSLLGSLRGVAQTISYEISMSLILLSCLISMFTLNFSLMYHYFYLGAFMLFSPLFLVWFTSTLAETNRTPFDFAEGESELVSGFNTEYSGVTFALIFMAEYLNILVMSLFSSLMFMPCGSILVLKDFFIIIYTIFFSVVFIWIRGSFPRMRYDRLMGLTWKVFLPFSLCLLIMFICLIIMM